MLFVCLYCVFVGGGIGVGSQESDAFSSSYGFVCRDGVTREAMYVLKCVGRLEVC